MEPEQQVGGQVVEELLSPTKIFELSTSKQRNGIEGFNQKSNMDTTAFQVDPNERGKWV